MRITGTADLAAPPDRVYAALNDPLVLSATIPGVRALERIGDDRYAMTITAGVASVKGAYTGEVSLSEQKPPESFTLCAKGSGAPGTVDATVRVTLAPDGSGTRLAYDTDAMVGGMVGGVGQRMLSSVARRMASEFFAAVDRVILDGLPVVPVPGPVADDVPAAAAISAGTDPAGAVAAVTAVSGPTASAAWAPPRDDDRVPFWVVLAGVGAGAFWALAGVAVGYRIAKGSRR